MAASTRGKTITVSRPNNTRWKALKPANATIARPGTIQSARLATFANAAPTPSVIKKTIPDHTSKGATATRMTSAMAGASRRDGFANPVSCRKTRDKDNRKDKPITKKNRKGRVLALVQGKMPDAWPSKVE